MVAITRYRDVPTGLYGLQRLSRMLDEAFSGWPFQEGDEGALTSAWVPPVDVSEDPNAVRLTVELPGVRAEDVKLSVENNMLTIRGEKKQESREERGQVRRYERSYGLFERAFALPSTVDQDKIEARFENGILEISIPKSERARPREIPVSAGKAGGSEVEVSTGSRSEGRKR